jgi:AraC family transcriptional regulator
MRDNLGEPLTVDDLARSAMFSKFHFTRIFRRVTGTSPGRFLSAMRLQQAKQLLVSTTLNVADISNVVGYSSVGTFSSRFTRSVGLSPTAYRRSDGFAPQVGTVGPDKRTYSSVARLCGHLRADGFDTPGAIFVGLFPERIPEGRPVRCAVLAGPGPYELDEVPPGRWFVLAQSLTPEPESLSDDELTTARGMLVGTRGPITVRAGSGMMPLDLRLKPPRSVDPPVLLALMDPCKVALGLRFRRQPALRTPQRQLSAA